MDTDLKSEIRVPEIRRKGDFDTNWHEFSRIGRRVLEKVV
jgi:hypothetical protein